VVKALGGWDNKCFNWIWEANVSPRVKIFFWKVQTCRLPTGDLLAQRGCSTSVECGLCSRECESAEHLLCSCQTSSPIWSWISPVLGVKEVFADISELVSHLGCVTVDQGVSKGFAQSVLMYEGIKFAVLGLRAKKMGVEGGSSMVVRWIKEIKGLS